jgi:hypothetical protein
MRGEFAHDGKIIKLENRGCTDNLIGDRENPYSNIKKEIEIMNLFYYIQDYEKLKMKM